MAYQNNIPRPTDLISVSQGDLLGNFGTIDNLATLPGSGVGFTRNHVTMTDGTNGGLHSRVDFYQDVVDPTVSGFVGSMYTKSVTTSKVGGGTVSNDEVFRRNATVAGYANNIMQIGGIFNAAASGYCTLFGGIMVQWGVGAATGSSVSFPIAFPNNAFAMTVTGSSTLYTGGFVVSALSTTAFTVSRTSGSGATGYYFVAFGN